MIEKLIPLFREHDNSLSAPVVTSALVHYLSIDRKSAQLIVQRALDQGIIKLGKGLKLELNDRFATSTVKVDNRFATGEPFVMSNLDKLKDLIKKIEDHTKEIEKIETAIRLINDKADIYFTIEKYIPGLGGRSDYERVLIEADSNMVLNILMDRLAENENNIEILANQVKFK